MRIFTFFFLISCTFNIAFAGYDSLFVVYSGDEAIVWHKNTESNCVSQFYMDVTIKQDTIIIIERDTAGIFADCMCFFDLNVTFKNLYGNYIVMIYRQQLMKYNYPNDTTYLIGTVNYSLSNPNLLPYFTINSFQSGCGGVSVKEKYTESNQPKIFDIRNFPNPFNSTTNFSFSLTNRENISIIIYDILGKEIETIFSGSLNPGNHNIKWQALNTSSGVYFYRISIGNQFYYGKMSLVR